MERPLGVLAEKGKCALMAPCKEGIWIFWRNSNRRSPLPSPNLVSPSAICRQFTVPTSRRHRRHSTKTNLAVFISHCLHVTAFHVSPIPIIQFSPKVLTMRIAVSPFAGFVKNAMPVNGDGWMYHPMIVNFPRMELLCTVSWLIKYMLYAPSLLWWIQTGIQVSRS